MQGDSGNREHRDDDAIERRLRELHAEISDAARGSAQEKAKEKAKKEKRQRRSGNGRLRAVPVAAVVLLAVAGVITWRLSSSSSALNDTNTVHNGAVPTGSSTAVVAPAIQAGPPADAFAGTPADHWADGAAGIVPPAAKPSGQFTSAQVAAAMQITRKLLIAGNLDGTTLNGGAPTAFADLLTPQQRTDFVNNLDKIGLDKDGYTTSSRAWVMSFAPGTVSFVTNVVKVHGSMSAGTAALSGRTALRIAVDYLFAYAIEPPGHPGDWMRVVAQDYGDVYFAQWDDPGGPLEPWVKIGISPAGGQCGMTDGYVHPAYPNGARSTVQPSGAPVNPYSPAPPPTSGTGTCHNTTGT
jgi:hypothetical protein